MVGRILRHLSSNHVVEEVSPDTFKLAAFNVALVEPVFGAWISYL